MECYKYKLIYPFLFSEKKILKIYFILITKIKIIKNMFIKKYIYIYIYIYIYKINILYFYYMYIYLLQ